MIAHTDDGVDIRIAARGETPDLRAVLAGSHGVVRPVGSTGARSIEPLVTVTAGERTGFFPNASIDTCERLAQSLETDAAATLSGAPTVVDHDRDPRRLPVPDLQELAVSQRDVLGIAGWLQPTAPDAYASAVGFDDSPVDRIDGFGAAIDGRGWGDWCRDEPLLGAWETARQRAETATVVVNAHGSVADTLLLSSAPMLVLDGADAVARATDADRAVVYLSEADETAVERARAAADSYPDPAAPFDVVTGPAVYRAAEPTMALEAIEGNHRLEARLRPPGPDGVGLDGDPTVVHTARTVAHLATALDRGTPSKTRIVTVTGDVDTPVTVELPETATLSDVLDAVDTTGEFKAACVGGRFGGLTGTLDVAPDPASLSAAGLGTEGVVDVLSTDRCVVEFVGTRAGFAADNNCGRCVPCREGTVQLAELLRGLYDGRFDADGIEELVGVMASSSICTFGVDAGRPTRTAIREFESEFRAHADGSCPAGSCPQPADIPQ